MASNYPAADAQSDLDMIACAWDLLEAAIGDDEAGTAELRRGAKNTQDRIGAAYSTYDDKSFTATLMPPVHALREGLTVGQVMLDQFGDLLRGLQSEMGQGITGGTLDAWLTSTVRRVHPNVQDLAYLVFGSYLTASNVFPLVTELGALARAAGTWTFTDGDAISPADDHVGAAQVELYVPAGITIGAADCVCTLTFAKYSGSTEQKSATMPSGSTAGTAVAVGTSSDIYVDCTLVSVTGGTNGDEIGIRTKLLRDVSGACS